MFPTPPIVSGPNVASRRPSTISVFVVGAFAIAALYFARELFVPLALAVLLSFALGPPVMLLRRWHFGRVPSVGATVVLAFLVIFGVGAILLGQVTHLAERLPLYQSNITAKIRSLQVTTTSDGIFGRTANAVKNLGKEIAKPSMPAPKAPSDASNPSPTGGSAPKKPVPVEVHQPEPTTLEIARSIVGPLLQPLATIGIVIVFVLLFLLQREDLRDRFIRLAGGRDLRRTTRALDDAAHRLSRYLLVQTAINAAFGTIIGTGLWLIGVPNPLLGGILAMLLQFVPYIGAPIAALFPAALALAVDPGWSMFLWTLGLFIITEPIVGQVVEPMLYGHSTGLSAVAVVVSAAFWTWLWGPIGLLLSTPLTVCLVVLGRHVEHLQFLSVLLGNQAALTPAEGFYQRVLADDPDEAAHQAEQFLKDHSLAAYYDEVAIEGLALAQLDVNRGALDHENRVQVKEAVLEIIDDLSDHVGGTPSSDEQEIAPLSDHEATPETVAGTVLCIAGRGSLDEAAATMLAQLLTVKGIASRVVPSAAVSAANIFALDVSDVTLVCLSYLEPGGMTSAHYLVRRLRRKLPVAPIGVGFWTLTADEARDRDAVGVTSADFVVTSLQEAVEQVAKTVRKGKTVCPPI